MCMVGIYDLDMTRLQFVLFQTQHTSSCITRGPRCPEAQVSHQYQVPPSTHQEESKDGGLVVLDQLALRLHLVEVLGLQSQPALFVTCIQVRIVSTLFGCKYGQCWASKASLHCLGVMQCHSLTLHQILGT